MPLPWWQRYAGNRIAYLCEVCDRWSVLHRTTLRCLS